MTRVLVAYGTKMAGTKGIAAAIGDELRRDGLEVEVRDANDVTDTNGFDAVVIGSAIYSTMWRSEAVKLLSRHATNGKSIPTWLFQSGPCGGDAASKQVPAPKKIMKLAAIVGAPEPMTFGGRLEPDTAVGFIAKKMAKGPMAGDFRDFDRIREWASTIAAQVVPAPHG